MMPHHRMPNFYVDTDLQHMIVRDIGPWDVYPTITNAAEVLVKHLHDHHNLGVRELFYYDTEGQLDQLVHDGNGNFLTFKSGGPQ